jgi:hypothetical protein
VDVAIYQISNTHVFTVHRVFATVAHKYFFARLCELVIALEGDLAHLLTSA